MADKESTFWDHLDALRRVLVRVVAVVAVLGVGAFVAMPWIFDNVIMAPCSPSFPVYELFDRIAGQTTADGFEVDVVSLELASQLFVHLSASCWVALIVGFPVVIYLLWGYMSTSAVASPVRSFSAMSCSISVLPQVISLYSRSR